MDFLRIFVIFVNMEPLMGAKVSKRFPYKSPPKVFKILLNFLPDAPHKTAFGTSEILKIEILTIFFVFVNMGLNRSQKFKTLLLQIAVKTFETSPDLSSHLSSQNYVCDV